MRWIQTAVRFWRTGVAASVLMGKKRHMVEKRRKIFLIYAFPCAVKKTLSKKNEHYLLALPACLSLTTQTDEQSKSFKSQTLRWTIFFLVRITFTPQAYEIRFINPSKYCQIVIIWIHVKLFVIQQLKRFGHITPPREPALLTGNLRFEFGLIRTAFVL